MSRWGCFYYLCLLFHLFRCYRCHRNSCLRISYPSCLYYPQPRQCILYTSAPIFFSLLLYFILFFIQSVPCSLSSLDLLYHPIFDSLTIPFYTPLVHPLSTLYTLFHILTSSTVISSTSHLSCYPVRLCCCDGIRQRKLWHAHNFLQGNVALCRRRFEGCLHSGSNYK